MAFVRTIPFDRQAVCSNCHGEADRIEAERIEAEEAAEERYQEISQDVREEGDWLTLLGDYALAHPVHKDLIQASLQEGELRSTAIAKVISKAIAMEAEKRVRAEGHTLV